MKIIPAIDIIDGKCVRLVQGDYTRQTIYSKDPVDVAKTFEDHGMTNLHLVDLDGARSQHIINYKVLERIAIQTNLEIDFGGGIKTDEDIQLAFDYGSAKVSVGSNAANQPELFKNWIERYGSDKIILGADCRDEWIVTSGWLQKSDINIIDFIKTYTSMGITQAICTDTTCDGMLRGPSKTLYEKILTQTSVKLFASGGISSVQDIIDLKTIGCTGAIIGKALYENQIPLSQLRDLC